MTTPTNIEDAAVAFEQARRDLKAFLPRASTSRLLKIAEILGVPEKEELPKISEPEQKVEDLVSKVWFVIRTNFSSGEFTMAEVARKVFPEDRDSTSTLFLRNSFSNLERMGLIDTPRILSGLRRWTVTLLGAKSSPNLAR